MARTKGARSAHYLERRAELLERLRERLARADAPYPSFRELVEASGVGQTTLRHYFGGRDAVIAVVLGAWKERGAGIFQHLTQPSGSFEQSVFDALAFAVEGHRLDELRQLHRVGLAEGLRSSTLGPAVVDSLIEPMLGALAARLEAHVRRGEMRAVDIRGAALSLISPVLVAFLHQADLGGAAEHHFDIDGFVRQHAEGFIAAYSI